MRIGLVGCLLAALATLPALAQSTAPVACDRACLNGFVDRYLDAMQAHAVSPELFARETKFTENGVQLPLGNEGLWATTTAPGQVQVLRARRGDPAGRLPRHGDGAVDELRRPAGARAGRPVAAAADRRRQDHRDRADRRAARAAARAGGGAEQQPVPATGVAVEALGAPHPVFLTAVPEAERMERADLVAVANQYFEGMQRNDGKGYYPFTDDCLRHENGMISAGPAGRWGQRASRWRPARASSRPAQGRRVRDPRPPLRRGRPRARDRVRLRRLRPPQHQLDLGVRRAVQDRAQPDPPDRGDLHPRAVRGVLGVGHLRAGDLGGAAGHPLVVGASR